MCIQKVGAKLYAFVRKVNEKDVQGAFQGGELKNIPLFCHFGNFDGFGITLL